MGEEISPHGEWPYLCGEEGRRPETPSLSEQAKGGKMKKRQKVKHICFFCGQECPDGEYRKSWILVAKCDDPENPESLNKLATPAHIECLRKFIRYNFDIILNMIQEGW